MGQIGKGDVEGKRKKIRISWRGRRRNEQTKKTKEKEKKKVEGGIWDKGEVEEEKGKGL